ncbi:MULTISPECIES: TraB/GumN family protein [Gluconobacter]|uniref:TraB/GumN family protein n=1 Tax=Gluconobacter TaxID=441 RepID=UPI00062C5E02|nr:MULTISPECIES: TraB/GumN family protein [Gluconobacter]
MKTFWLAAILAIAPSLAVAQAPRCPAPAAVPSKSDLPHLLMTSQDRGFLWKATKDGHTSWLYGTVHASREEWLMPGPLIRSAILRSQAVALELNLQDPQTLAALRKPEEPANREKLIASGRKKKLDALADELCIPTAGFATTAIGLEAAGLSASAARADGYYPDYAVDFVLQGMAGSLKKEVIALEDIQTQRNLLISPKLSEENAFIDETIKQISSGEARKDEDQLIAMWGRSDLTRLNQYKQWCKCERTPQEKRQTFHMIDERNAAMAQKILTLHDSGKSLFVAVGSLHMAGPQGLPALLKKDGFDVQQIVPALSANTSL